MFIYHITNPELL